MKMPALKDLTGQRFGRLVVLDRAPNDRRYVCWRCLCDCGTEKVVKGALLNNGTTQSCGCLHKEQLSKRSIKDLRGQKFGRLLALEPTEERRDNKVVWKCQCECGKITYVQSTCLISGSTKSCGCLNSERIGDLNRKDISGKRFGRLTAIRRISGSNGSSSGSLWQCKCDCGNIIQTRIHNLTDGSTQSCGCIKSRGEMKIQSILQKYNIPYEREKTFPTCISPDTGALLKFDFYLPSYNLLVEYDGIQHFQARGDNSWNNKSALQDVQKRDAIKNAWCMENAISLIRIPYTQFDTLTINDIIKEKSNVSN